MTLALLTSLLLTAPPEPPANSPPPKPAPAKTAPEPAKPATPTGPALAWRFTGTLSDGAGTVRFRIKGDRISHASAQVRGRAYTLRPSDLNDGNFKLIGNHEKDYIRISARLRRGALWVSGSYQGAVNRKRIKGTFTASRR